MSDDDTPIRGTSIVLVGSFNPAIIHPSWFARFELLPPSDLEAEQDLKLVTPDFTLFRIGWLRVQVTTDHFELSTVEHDRVPLLRDVVSNIFSLLSHTPVSAVGINRTAHYPTSEQGWDRIRAALAPADPWKQLATESALSSLTVELSRDGQEDDPGYVRVTVEPSQRIANGVFVSVNDHHDLRVGADEFREAGPARTVLESGWAAALERHKTFTDFVLELAGES